MTEPSSDSETLDAASSEGPGGRIGRTSCSSRSARAASASSSWPSRSDPVRRRVALKIIKLGMDTQTVVAPLRGRAAGAGADGPPEHRQGLRRRATTDSGRPYFVMELVKGEPITEYCDKHKLSTRERLELFVQVCQAVQHAHQKGDHPPRHQADQRPGQRCRTAGRAEGDRLRHRQGDEQRADREDAVHRAPASSSARRST